MNAQAYNVCSSVFLLCSGEMKKSRIEEEYLAKDDPAKTSYDFWTNNAYLMNMKGDPRFKVEFDKQLKEDVKAMITWLK